jgi:hypothetical protein
MAWMNNFVDPEISQNILWMDNASEICKELKVYLYQSGVFIRDMNP